MSSGSVSKSLISMAIAIAVAVSPLRNSLLAKLWIAITGG